MSDSTDQVLRGVIRDWIRDLPAAERADLLSEVQNTPETPPPAPEPTPKTGSIAKGRELFERRHGRKIDVEPSEHITNGGW